VQPAELGASEAPLALVFERLTGISPYTMSLIAIVATLNGIIVQIILASRVFYGLARLGSLPAAFQKVSTFTRTPLLATAVAVAVVLALALLLPLEQLADLTSRFTLIMFALINLALIRIKRREPEPPRNVYVAPFWMPWAGLVSCVVLLIADLIAILMSVSL
jgi:amino acid transporter